MNPISIPTRQFPASLALITIIAGATIHANAAVIADLRGDYDTPSTAHTNGQTSAGRIPDTFGTGSWNFFARNTVAPGGTQTALVYDTSANDVRASNAYVYPAGTLSLPAISNNKLIDGPLETSPAADELGLHPGRQSLNQRFLVVRWTAGLGESFRGQELHRNILRHFVVLGVRSFIATFFGILLRFHFGGLV